MVGLKACWGWGAKGGWKDRRWSPVRCMHEMQPRLGASVGMDKEVQSVAVGVSS